MTNRTLSNLIELGEENLGYFKNSLNQIEKGEFFEVKRVASTIRTLIHKTSNSHSLIKQIENHPANSFDKECYFYANNQPLKGSLLEGLNTAIRCQLPRMRFDDSIENHEEYFRTWNTLDDWWNGLLYKSPLIENHFTRKNIVLHFANKDGGSHVDPNIPLTEQEALNSIKVINDLTETTIGYVMIIESGISMYYSFKNYLNKVKEVNKI
jgi:hypothetical protein